MEKPLLDALQALEERLATRVATSTTWAPTEEEQRIRDLDALQERLVTPVATAATQAPTAEEERIREAVYKAMAGVLTELELKLTTLGLAPFIHTGAWRADPLRVAGEVFWRACGMSLVHPDHRGSEWRSVDIEITTTADYSRAVVCVGRQTARGSEYTYVKMGDAALPTPGNTADIGTLVAAALRSM